jgi:hypothetical protein
VAATSPRADGARPGDVLENPDADIEPAKAVSHPDTVRRRPIAIDTTKFSGDKLPIKGSLSRIATISQTFLDTQDSPDLSGGMSHILDIWTEHATTEIAADNRPGLRQWARGHAEQKNRRCAHRRDKLR